jgi:hypothetical protein
MQAGLSNSGVIIMGHSTASMTGRFRAEREYFKGFRRALLMKSDQLLFDALWDEIEVYIPPAEKSNHPLLIATVLMSMILEQRKLFADLQCQLEKLQQENKSDRQYQEANLAQLKGEVQRLDEGIDSRLRRLRTELIEILYPVDAAS